MLMRLAATSVIIVLAMQMQISSAFLASSRCLAMRRKAFLHAADEGSESPETTEKLMIEEERQRSYSNSMKEKLRREAEALGGDPNVKSANPIALIGGIVAVLAVLSFASGAIQ